MTDEDLEIRQRIFEMDARMDAQWAAQANQLTSIPGAVIQLRFGYRGRRPGRTSPDHDRDHKPTVAPQHAVCR